MAGTGGQESQSPVVALRDYFGDRKLPEISRKITACVTCRKQKIKCHMRNGGPPCGRCQDRGLPCTVNRSLQMLMENDVRWKQRVDHKIQKLTSVVTTVAKQALSPDAAAEAIKTLRHLQTTATSSDFSGEGNSNVPQEDAENDAENDENRLLDQKQKQEGQNEPKSMKLNANDIVIDLVSSPADIPGFRFVQTPTDGSAGNDSAQDFISRGVISSVSAQKYLDVYQHRLDHFLYKILGCVGVTFNIETIRQTSAILTAAICAVGSLHLASPEFELCYAEFLSLAQSSSFSNESSPDDVRGLIIGAFWISDISRTLIGAAVRLAVEHQMHKSFYHAIRGDFTHYQRARLYYLIYVCDHHLSLVFGRPPMTRDGAVIRRVREFLNCEHAVHDDCRLVSQVLRWNLCSKIFDNFGDDDEPIVSGTEVAKFRRFSIAIDNLRAEWTDKFMPNDHIGNYPRKGVGLQCLFAKLYLCSRAIRSMGAATTTHARSDVDVLIELQEVANSAVVSATSILQVVVSDVEIQSFLNGLPTYFHTMIAFAAVFLLKVSLTSPISLGLTLHFTDVQQLLKTLVVTLKGVTSTVHSRHLLVPITNGLQSALDGIDRAQAMTASVNVDNGLDGSGSITEASLPWAEVETFASSFLGEYNFQWS